MDIILYLIIVIAISIKLFLINYYRKLFSNTVKKEHFTREELLDIKSILIREFNAFITDNPSIAYIGLSIGLLLAYLVVHIFPSYYDIYLLNSCILPISWYLGIPYLKSKYNEKIQNISYLRNLLDNDIYLLVGLTLGIISTLFMSYFEYRSLNFIWFITNFIIMLLLLLYRLFSNEKYSYSLENK